MFVFTLLSILVFLIIFKKNIKLVALLLLSYMCIVMWLFLVVPWVGLQYVIVVFADHTHLLFVCHVSWSLAIEDLNCLLLYMKVTYTM